MKDRQAKAVLEFESRLWNATVGHKVELAQLQRLITSICEHWKVRPATLRALPHELTKSRVGDCGDGIIRLSRKGGGQTGITAAHEAAHHVCDELYELIGEEIEPHGLEWAAVYAVTLDAFHIMPMVATLAAFGAYGVKTDKAIIERHLRSGKRASARLRKDTLRKKRQAQWPRMDGVLAKGSFGRDRRGVQTVVLVRVC